MTLARQGCWGRLGGYEIAVGQFDNEVRTLFGDNQSDPKAAISEFRRLVDSEQIEILVTTRSPVGLALNPLSVQKKVPLIGVIGHPRFTIENPYAVRVFPSARDEADVLAAAMKSKNDERLAIVSNEDEYFLALKEAIEKHDAIRERIVFSDTVSPTEQDLSAILLKVKATQPTALLLNVGPAQMAQLVKRVRESKLAINLYANFLIGMDDIHNVLGGQDEGIVYAELDYKKPMFLKAVRDKFGAAQVTPIGYSCYVALTYANRLARVARERDIPAYKAMEFITELPTLDGEIHFLNREAKMKVLPKVVGPGLSGTF